MLESILVPALALGFYCAWESLPHRLQTSVLFWFWTFTFAIGAIGIAYALLSSGSLPEPALTQ